MTVNNMAKYAMMTNSIGGVNGANSVLGSQNVSAAKAPASAPSFGDKLQAGRNSSYETTAAVRTSGNDLKSAVQNQKTAAAQLQSTTSNDKTATVSFDNAKGAQKSLSSMASDPVNLEVKQTALSQTNEGNAMAAKDKAVDAGSYSFAVETGGKTHNFSITVDENDTNASIQEKMAAAINERDIGITASVNADEKLGTSSLAIAADATGTDAAFEISDVSGDLTSAMGVNEATQEAQNAIYSVNGGGDIESQSNNVSIAEGVTATLNQAGTTEISSERDNKSAMQGVSDLVNSINSALKAANEGDGRGSERLARDIQSMNKSYSDSLARVGINVSANGELTIDEKKLEQAAKDGSLDRFFSDSSVGFNARAERIANNAVNSEYYADKQVSFSVDSFSINQDQLKFFNISNAGLLFNFLL